MTDAPERIWVYHHADAYENPISSDPLDPEYEKDHDLYISDAKVQELIRAAVEAETERCAKLCDTIAGNTADFDRYTRRAAGMCAAAIRGPKQ